MIVRCPMKVSTASSLVLSRIGIIYGSSSRELDLLGKLEQERKRENHESKNEECTSFSISKDNQYKVVVTVPYIQYNKLTK